MLDRLEYDKELIRFSKSTPPKVKLARRLLLNPRWGYTTVTYDGEEDVKTHYQPFKSYILAIISAVVMSLSYYLQSNLTASDSLG